MTGILLVDKQQDWTSSDVVAKLRGILHERRIGHAGTLDPLATGLLVVLVGRATRASEYAMAHDKEYIAGLRPGISTDTQDITGNIIGQLSCAVSEDSLKEACSKFLGDTLQVPPMYSAIKIAGRKLYEIARSGKEVERKPRSIHISSIEYLGRENEDFILDVQCSAGTYIRTLCNDIGRELGCGACMASLRRVKIGSFSIEDAHTLDEIQAAMDASSMDDLLIPIDALFMDYPEVTVTPEEECKLRNGSSFSKELENGFCRVYSVSGEFLMLGRAEDQVLYIEKSFYEPVNK